MSHHGNQYGLIFPPLPPPYDSQIGRTQRVSPLGAALAEATTRLIGPQFNGSLSNGTSDNFWITERGTNATSVIASSIATLTGGTTNADYATVASVRKARFLFANPNMCRMLLRFAAVAAANTTTRFGAITMTAGVPQDGFCFSVSGTGAVSVQSYKAAATVLNKASGFNGALGSTYSVPDTNMHAWEIIYFGAKVWLFVDGVLLHAEAPTTQTYTSTMTLPIGMSVLNGTSPTSRVLEAWFASTVRFGKELTRPQSSYIAANASTLLKTGSGTLHAIIVGNGVNGSITVYDALSATGTPLIVLTTINTTSPFTVAVEVDFFTGLFVVTSAATQVTVVYE